MANETLSHLKLYVCLSSIAIHSGIATNSGHGGGGGRVQIQIDFFRIASMIVV